MIKQIFLLTIVVCGTVFGTVNTVRAQEIDSNFARELGEVVVTGYTTQRKADLTGAVSVVNVGDIKNVSGNNPITALQGRVAGMSITADGNPSGSSAIHIRGIGTLDGNDAPLFIIDGVPTTGGMHELNSNDIESIQVLKDAASATIYGSRAANGVIIITTKRGEKGKIKIDFDGYATVSHYGKTVSMLNTEQYGRALWKANINDGQDPNTNGLGYNFDWFYDDNGNSVLNNMYLPKYLDTRYGSNTLPASNTSWFDEVKRTGVLQSYNISVSQATDKTNNFFSIGYLNNQGTVKYTDFNRISARMNGNYKLWKDIITVGENFTVNRTQEVTIPGGSLDLALQQLPIMPVKDINGDFSNVTPNMNDRENPMRVLYSNKDNRYTFWRIFGNAYLDIQPIKNFHIKSTFGVDYGNFYQRTLQHSYKGWITGSDITSSEMKQYHGMKWTWTNLMSYNVEIGKNRLDVLAGIEMIDGNDIDFSAMRQGFDVEALSYMYPNAGAGDNFAYGGSSGNSLLSYFAKANYVYDNRYLLSATIRCDGSSRFGKNNRYGWFPAFSAGWRISNETFMKDASNWLSDLKLRASWGMTGNQEIDNYANRTLLVADYIGARNGGEMTGTAYDINGVNMGRLPYGYMLSQLANDDVRWETTTQLNTGIDFGFFNGRLSGSLDYYFKYTRDMLIRPPYLGAIGEGGYNWVNGASMQNQGLELALSYVDKTSYGLTYEITGNISGYRNKITKLPESVILAYGGNGTTDVIIGRAKGTMYGYVVEGLFLSQEEADDYVTQNGKGIGRLKYANLNGDNVIDLNDRTWIGNPHPKFEFGINVALAWNGFDLSFFIQCVYGNMVYNNVKQMTDFWSVREPKMNKGTRVLDAYDPVTNPNSTIPALTLQNYNDEGRTSTYFVEPGSYLKLRNLQIGYSLPQSLLRKAKIAKVRFYLSGQNLFTIKSKKFTGLDPENPNLAYPIATSYTFGVNLGF